MSPSAVLSLSFLKILLGPASLPAEHERHECVVGGNGMAETRFYHYKHFLYGFIWKLLLHGNALLVLDVGCKVYGR